MAAESNESIEAPPSDETEKGVYSINGGTFSQNFQYSNYELQLVMSTFPQVSYEGILSITREMAVDMFDRARRVFRFVRDDSLADNLVKYKNFVVSKLNKRRVRREFIGEDVILVIVSILAFVYNIIVDVGVTVLYWREGAKLYSMVTLAVLLLPLILVNTISIMWYRSVNHDCSVEPVILQRTNRCSGPIAWFICVFMHNLLLGQLYRNIIMMYVGIKSWGEDRARERRKSEIVSAIAEYQRRAEQSDVSGSSVASETDSAIRMISRDPSFEGACDLPTDINPCVDYYALFVHQEFDIAILDLLDGFLHDGTQVIMQIYMILTPCTEEETRWRKVGQIQSAVMALITLSWCLSEYARAWRSSEPDKCKLNLLAMILMFFWRFLTLVPRVFAFALFATQYHLYLLVFVSCHWALMTFWVRRQRAVDGSLTTVLEGLACSVIGYVYIFCFLRIKTSEEPTRAKYFLFYSLVFVENSVLFYAWYSVTNYEYGLPLVFLLTAIYFVGLMFMVVYYKFAHHRDHLPDRTKRPRLS